MTDCITLFCPLVSVLADKVQTWVGKPPDGKISCTVEISKDDFFLVYSGKASTAEIGKMCLSGRIKVHRFRYRELQKFANSFDFSTETWINFYDHYGKYFQARQLEALDMVRQEKVNTLAEAVQHLHQQEKPGTEDFAHHLNVSLPRKPKKIHKEETSSANSPSRLSDTNISCLLGKHDAAFALLKSSNILHSLSVLMMVRQLGLEENHLQHTNVQAEEVEKLANMIWGDDQTIMKQSDRAAATSNASQSLDSTTGYKSSWGLTSLYRWAFGSDTQEEKREQVPVGEIGHSPHRRRKRSTKKSTSRKDFDILKSLRERGTMLPVLAESLETASIAWVPTLRQTRFSSHRTLPGTYLNVYHFKEAIIPELSMGTVVALFFDLLGFADFRRHNTDEIRSSLDEISELSRQVTESAKQFKPEGASYLPAKRNGSASDLTQVLSQPRSYSFLTVLAMQSSLKSHINALTFLREPSFSNPGESLHQGTDNFRKVRGDVPVETGHYPHSPSAARVPVSTPTAALEHILNHHMVNTPYAFARATSQCWNARLLDGWLEERVPEPKQHSEKPIRNPKDFASHTISTIAKGLPSSRSSALHYAFGDTDLRRRHDQISYYPYIRIPKDTRSKDDDDEESTLMTDNNKDIICNELSERSKQYRDYLEFLSAPMQARRQLSSVTSLPLWLSCSLLPLSLNAALSPSFRCFMDSGIQHKISSMHGNEEWLQSIYKDSVDTWNSEAWKCHIHTLAAATSCGVMKPWDYVPGNGPTHITSKTHQTKYTTIWEMFMKPYTGVIERNLEGEQSVNKLQQHVKSLAKKVARKADSAFPKGRTDSARVADEQSNKHGDGT